MGRAGSAPSGAVPAEELRGTPVDLYSLTKQASEDATRILAAQHGLRVVWARLFNLVGPGQDERHLFGAVAAQLTAIGAGLRPPELELGALDPTRDFVDVRDAADALWLLAQHGEPGLAYNVASGAETSIGAAVALLIDAAGLDGRVAIRPLPPRALDVPRHWGDIGRLRGLGFAPRIPLRDSARDLLAYYAGPVAAAAARPALAWRPARITVAAAARAEYAVEVAPGLLDRLPARLAADFPGRRMAMLTDTRVWQLHGERFLGRLRAAGLAVEPLLLPEGEASKSPERYLALIDQLHAARFDRRGLLVNFGGGLVTDVGGFVAATYLRGVDYVNAPTTLLAQHDSAIGGKVAVNAPWAKNFIGAFHHPRAVYCDPRVLATLPARDVSAGVAEAIKVALCGDPDLFRLLERSAPAIRAREPDAMAEVVLRAAARKAALLAPDPYEIDLRRVLNLGHTFGHALEAEHAYGAELLHGEAVAFGIAVATAIGVERGVCSRVDGLRIFALLRAYDRFHAYRKGPFVMYALREYVGGERVFSR